MRILFLVHRIPYPPNKGDKIRSFAELRALAEDNKVDLFCFYDDPADEPGIAELRKHCESCYAEWLNPWGARLRALLAIARGRCFSVDYYRSQAMRRRVNQALESAKYDGVLVFCSSMAQYAFGTGVPCVVDMVDVDSDKWTQYARHQSWFTRWLWRREGEYLAEYERQITRDAGSVVLCTEPEKEILRGVAPGAQNIRCVPNSIDLEYWDPEKVEVGEDVKNRTPYVIFPGQMDYYPNVEAALRFYEQVFPLLRQTIPDVKFAVAGRNPSRAVRRLASDPGVWITGTVADMRPLLKGAAAAVIPLRIARGVQNKILECLAMGLPVASSAKAAAGLPAAVAELLTVADEPAELAAALSSMILRRSSGQIGQMRRIVEEHFGFEALKRSIGELLHQAASSTREVHTAEVR